MAIFEDNDNPETGTNSIDYSLLQNGSINLFYRNNILGDVVELLEKKGYIIKKLNCSEWNKEQDFHKDVTKILDFPSYYGENLDAFNDCISMLDVPTLGAYVIVFTQYDHFFKLFPKMSWTVLNILENNSRFYLLFGKRLIILVQSDDPTIHFESLGGKPANWNSKEWLNRNRNL